jgi:hypothetical protein
MTTTALEGLSGRIEHATLAMLDAVGLDIWRAHGGGLLSDDEAQHLAETAQRRREAVRSGSRPVVGGVQGGDGTRKRPWSYFPPKRPAQRSPDRQRSITRRRQLAASGPMPPSLAAQFTTGELAVLRIVADEVAASGQCSRTVGEMAARAGVGLSTARNAIRQASRLGLLTVEERRRHQRPNLSNVIRIVSGEWSEWMKRGPRGEGSKMQRPRSDRFLYGFMHRNREPKAHGGERISTLCREDQVQKVNR